MQAAGERGGADGRQRATHREEIHWVEMDGQGRWTGMRLVLAVWLGCAASVAVAPSWSILSSPCPEGMRYMTLAEATSDAQTICGMIDDWTIVEVGNHNGPGLGGSGYQCSTNPTQCSSGCTQSVCTPGAEGEGEKEGEEIAIWAISVFVCISLYAGGGAAWHYHTQGQIGHPHVPQWKHVGGLVKDGFAFLKAKHSGEPFVPTEERAPLNGKDQETYAATAKSDPEDPAKLAESSPKPKKKKKDKSAEDEGTKKKKKKKKPAADSGEAKE